METHPARSTLPARRLTERRAQRLAAPLALLAVCLGTSVLVGWITGIETLKRVVPGYVAMVPTTALCFVLIAVGLLLNLMGGKGRVMSGVGFGAIAGAIVLVNFSLSIFGETRGLEELVFEDWNGFDSMALGTELAFFAAIFCLVSISTERFWHPTALLAVATGGLMLAALAILGYLFGSSDLYAIFLFDEMAVHTAVGFLLLHSAFLLAQPSYGWVGLMLGRGSGSKRARRLFPIVVLLPIALCFVALRMTEAGMLSENLRLALLAIAMVALSTLTLLIHANGENRAERIAKRDPLTGLANRARFTEELEEVIAGTRDGSKAGLVLIDLDHFKRVNDTMGHVAGDKLLGELARRLRSQMSNGDIAARIGGDEFAAILAGRDSRAQLEEDVEKIFRDLHRPVTIGDRAVDSTVSLGVAVFPEDSQSQEDLVIRADLALYEAKSLGRAAVRFHQDRGAGDAGPNDDFVEPPRQAGE